MKNALFILFIFFLMTGNLFAQISEAHIEQVGSYHEAQIEQEANIGTGNNYHGNFPGKGVDDVPPGVPFQDNNGGAEESGSYAEIFQFDTGNIASVIQAGNHWGQIYQDGFENFASIVQEGNGGGGVSFNPPGVANPCPPPFAPCEGSSEDGSVALIYQEGDRNTASIEQDLGSNEAKIIQYGSDLEAIIHQFGDGNYASILQDFRGLSTLSSLTGFRSAEIEQTNNDNIATVEQTVPTSIPIEIIQNGNMEIHVEHH